MAAYDEPRFFFHSAQYSAFQMTDGHRFISSGISNQSTRPICNCRERYLYLKEIKANILGDWSDHIINKPNQNTAENKRDHY